MKYNVMKDSLQAQTRKSLVRTPSLKNKLCIDVRKEKCSNPKGLVFEHLIDDMRKAIFIMMRRYYLGMRFDNGIPIDHRNTKATALNHLQIVEIVAKCHDFFDIETEMLGQSFNAT